MAIAPPNHERRYLYGPFFRRFSETQTSATTVKQLLSGEIWGKTPRQGLSPTVQAFAGPLPAGETGIEFWAFQKPDNVFGPISHWNSEGPYVTIDKAAEVAKLSAAFVRVSPSLIKESS
jgi:hypothetical protein